MNKPIIVEEQNALAELPKEFTGQHSSLAVSLARAEVDQQITTAHAYPRSITRAVQNIMTLATLDERSAEECVYALPRAGKAIKGPSVRLAEIIASQWGNCRVGARVVHVDRIEKYVEAEGVFHDLETNTATTARVRRRISGKNGRVYDDDMIVVTGNAACAIAKRNAILGAVPKAVWRKAYDSVEAVLVGDVKTLAERRDGAMKAFAAFGVKPDLVFAALGIGGVDDVTLEHISTLIAMHSALKSGEATVEEMFPAQAAKPPTEGANLSEKLGNLANEKKDPPHDPKTGEVITERDGGRAVDDGGRDDEQNSDAAREPQSERGERSDGPQSARPEKDSRDAAPKASGKDAGGHAPQSGPPASGDDHAGAPRADDTPAMAKEYGKRAKEEGLSRRARPAVYNDSDELMDAWDKGYSIGKAPAQGAR